MREKIKKRVHKFIREENLKKEINWRLLKALYSYENDYFKSEKYFYFNIYLSIKFYKNYDWFVSNLDFEEFFEKSIKIFFENYFSNINNFLVKIQKSSIHYQRKILNNILYSQDIRNFYIYIDEIFREKFTTYEEVYIFLSEIEKYFKCDIIIENFMINRLKNSLRKDYFFEKIENEEQKRNQLKKLEEMRETRKNEIS
jgi:integrase